MGAVRDIDIDVLIVEDDDANRDMLQRRFSRHGVRAAGVASGREAMSVARERPPGVILLDLSLGVQTGEEVISALKSDLQTWTIPIVVLSGHAGSRERDAWQAGCDDYLTKPVDFDALLGKVRSLLT